MADAFEVRAIARHIGISPQKVRLVVDVVRGKGAEEALDILGLNADATEEDIIESHRRLIQKLHPDRGGSAYLASKINLAKDTLLGR